MLLNLHILLRMTQLKEIFQVAIYSPEWELSLLFYYSAPYCAQFVESMDMQDLKGPLQQGKTVEKA